MKQKDSKTHQIAMGIIAGIVAVGMTIPAMASTGVNTDSKVSSFTINNFDNTKITKMEVEAGDIELFVPEQQVTYEITIVNAENGSISANLEEAEEGKEIILTVEPNVGYVLEELVIRDEAGDNEIIAANIGDNAYTFVMPACNVVVTGNFSLDETTDLPHTHTVSDEWNHNEDTHWHECIAQDGEKFEEGSHEFGEWTVEKEPSEIEAGVQNRSCSVCGYIETQEIPAPPLEEEHIHVASDEWSYNEELHWRECIAKDGEKLEESSHEFGEWIIEKEATDAETGIQNRICSICGYSETQIIEVKTPPEEDVSK